MRDGPNEAPATHRASPAARPSLGPSLHRPAHPRARSAIVALALLGWLGCAAQRHGPVSVPAAEAGGSVTVHTPDTDPEVEGWIADVASTLSAPSGADGAHLHVTVKPRSTRGTLAFDCSVLVTDAARRLRHNAKSTASVPWARDHASNSERARVAKSAIEQALKDALVMAADSP